MNIFSDPEGADTFTDPLDNTYVLWSRFIMPTTEGGIHSVAATDRQAFYMASAYAILVTGIFGFLWQFITYLILVLYPTEIGQSEIVKKEDSDRYNNPSILPNDANREASLLKVRKRKANRYIALVAIWNSSDPWTAMKLLIEHAWLSFRDKEHRTGLYDTALVIIALTMALGNIAAGVIIPANLEMGNVAPANPENVFFANPILGELSSRIQQMRSPAAQRAMGVVEAAGVQLDKRVTVSPAQVMDRTGPNGERIEQVTYSYNITGVDLGLQHMDAVNFVMSTQGACTLEYGWFNTTESDDSWDVYDLFSSSDTIQMHVLRDSDGRPASGRVVIPTTSYLANIESGGNATYAILPDTLNRQSRSEGTDPWYTTIPSNSSVVPFEVANRRPALSCWQKDTWSYKEHNAASILELKDLPGLDLPPVIRDEFIPSRFAYPMIYDIASSLGGAILVSSTSSDGGLLDASTADYHTDFRRLVLASFVASRDILRDTTMIVERYNLTNDAFEGNRPKQGAGDFVISSAKVSTLSLKILISVPTLFVFLWIALEITRCTRYTHRNSGTASRFTLRAVGLQAVQMYRLLDEEVCGYRDDWIGRKDHMPYISEARPVHPQSQRVSVYSAKSPGTPDFEKQALVSEKEIEVISGTNHAKGVVENSQAPAHALFIAPKVVMGPDGRYHLRFTGPVDYEKKQKKKEDYKWSWQHDEGDRAVADGPLPHPGST